MSDCYHVFYAVDYESYRCLRCGEIRYFRPRNKRMQRFIEIRAQWKFGTQIVRMPTKVNVNAIFKIERFPEELPDWADGVLSRVCLVNGEQIPCNDTYEYLSEILDKVEL